jgi:hypothetical protein
MKTKKPIAILYNWYKKGEFTLRSEIYHEENLYDEVIIHSLDSVFILLFYFIVYVFIFYCVSLYMQ